MALHPTQHCSSFSDPSCVSQADFMFAQTSASKLKQGLNFRFIETCANKLKRGLDMIHKDSKVATGGASPPMRGCCLVAAGGHDRGPPGRRGTEPSKRGLLLAGPPLACTRIHETRLTGRHICIWEFRFPGCEIDLYAMRFALKGPILSTFSTDKVMNAAACGFDATRR